MNIPIPCLPPVFSLMGRFQKVIDTEGRVFEPSEECGYFGSYGDSESRCLCLKVGLMKPWKGSTPAEQKKMGKGKFPIPLDRRTPFFL